MNGNLTILSAGISALAATTALTPGVARAQSFPGGLYVAIGATSAFPGKPSPDLNWLNNQAVVCSSTSSVVATQCAFTQTNNGSYAITGIYFNVKWSDYAPCGVVGTGGSLTSCAEPWVNSNGTTTTVPVDRQKLYTISQYGTSGLVTGSSTITAYYNTSVIDQVLADLQAIETGPRHLPLKLAISLTGGDYRVSCTGTQCQPTASGLPLMPPAGGSQYNTPYWVMNAAISPALKDGTIVNGFVYTIDNASDVCYMSPAPWGSVYSQLYADALVDMNAYITASTTANHHNVDVVKFGGLNGHDQEIAVSGFGSFSTTNPSCTNTTSITNRDAGAASWLYVEGYTTQKVEKAFQYFVNAIESNVGSNVATAFMLVDGDNIPLISPPSGSSNGTLLTGSAATRWPEKFVGGMIFDLFGGVSTTGASLPAANLLATLPHVPPFGATGSGGVTNGKPIALFAVQTDGLVNQAACMQGTTYTCSGQDSNKPEYAPTALGAPNVDTDFENQLNCQLSNQYGSNSIYGTSSGTYNNILSNTTTFVTSSGGTANLGPFTSSAGTTSTMASGFQNYPDIVAGWSSPPPSYGTGDAPTIIATAELAATFGGNYVEIWASGIGALMQAGAANVSALGTATAALSAGNAAGCYAGVGSGL